MQHREYVSHVKIREIERGRKGERDRGREGGRERGERERGREENIITSRKIFIQNITSIFAT